MSKRKVRRQLDPMNEINMTPLIDLTFLLLIVFMITMPLLENGLNVTPPSLKAEKLPDEKCKAVTLDKSGKIVFEKVEVSKEELLRDLKNLFRLDPKISILLRADGIRQYNEVINVLKVIKESGFTNVSLVTLAE